MATVGVKGLTDACVREANAVNTAQLSWYSCNALRPVHCASIIVLLYCIYIHCDAEKNCTLLIGTITLQNYAIL